MATRFRMYSILTKVDSCVNVWCSRVNVTSLTLCCVGYGAAAKAPTPSSFSPSSPAFLSPFVDVPIKTVYFLGDPNLTTHSCTPCSLQRDESESRRVNLADY